MTGAAIGIAQFLVLRHTTDRAAIWVPVVALGWALGCAAAANITLNLVMIPVFGIEGAAGFEARLRAADEFAFDTETDGLDPLCANLVGDGLRDVLDPTLRE